MLFELLALRVPFPGRHIYEMYHLIVRTPPPEIPEHYSRDVADLVKCVVFRKCINLACGTKPSLGEGTSAKYVTRDTRGAGLPEAVTVTQN